jgi:hypothetical protein
LNVFDLFPQAATPSSEASSPRQPPHPARHLDLGSRPARHLDLGSHPARHLDHGSHPSERGFFIIFFFIQIIDFFTTIFSSLSIFFLEFFLQKAY